MGFITCLMYCCTRVLIESPVWTSQDEQHLDIARKRCGKIYKNSPCLTTFTKVEDGMYRATCGKNNND